MSYSIKELTVPIDSDRREKRSREIFLDLKDKASKGEPLSEHEKNFLYEGIRFSIYNEGKVTDYPACENSIFKDTYLYYYSDLTGGSIYYKPVKGKAIEVPFAEARQDLDYLIDEAKKWLVEIKKTNHKEELIQQISKETREQIKDLDSSPEIKNDIYAKGKFIYRYKQWSLLLNSKFVYLTCIEIIETLTIFPYQLELNSTQIEFNEFSLIHIIMRHFAETTKKFETEKSYHSEDFNPRHLALDLENIFQRIESKTTVDSINNVIFEFKGGLYDIWIKERTKSIKGKGNVRFHRIETFYPIIEESKLEKIKTDFIKIEINEELYYFKHK